MVKKYNIILYVFFILIFFFYLDKVFASEREITFEQQKEEYNIGDDLDVKIIINTNEDINAISANILFSDDILTLESIYKEKSIINFWVEEPYHSNNTGVVSFKGIVLNGFKGKHGLILDLHFKAKSEGTANINFLSSLILANNGKGTELNFDKKSIVVLVNNNNDQSKLNRLKCQAYLDDCFLEKLNNTKIVKDVVSKIHAIESNYNLPRNFITVIILIFSIVLFLLFIIMYIIFYVKKIETHVKNRLNKKTENQNK